MDENHSLFLCHRCPTRYQVSPFGLRDYIKILHAILCSDGYAESLAKWVFSQAYQSYTCLTIDIPQPAGPFPWRPITTVSEERSSKPL